MVTQNQKWNWTHIGPVQEMVCLLSCADEVFKYKAFGMVILSVNHKIWHFVFLSYKKD